MDIKRFNHYTGTKLNTPAPIPTSPSLGSQPKSPFTEIHVGLDSFIIVKPKFPSQKFEIKFSDGSTQNIVTSFTSTQEALELNNELQRAFKTFEDITLGCELLKNVVQKVVDSFYLNY